ncbi:trans-sulfuration enzyme family protein [Actinobaculum suis]|uniref:trans-sulfuration enzyme family protein n=1 Tax=Actinobaculum suis TaxID=1657 RepID=UPI0009F32A8B|nr:PLP-dependent aspartate aminotransferase family protein [Actinobaculum suis]
MSANSAASAAATGVTANGNSASGPASDGVATHNSAATRRGVATRLVHTAHKDEFGAIAEPIYLSSSYRLPADGSEAPYAYQRSNNPTRESAERAVASLEGAAYAIGTATGMGAISTVFSQLKPGDHVVLTSAVYGGTFLYVQEFFAARGITANFESDLNNLEALPENTTLVFIETPTNPTFRVTDIAHAAKLAHAVGAQLVVDNTFSTALWQRPLELGADVVVYSATKFLGGHSDVLAGFIVLNDAAAYEKYKRATKALGNVLSPFDSYSILRGLKTLAVRLDKQQENAAVLRELLSSHPAVSRVLVPGWYSKQEAEIQAAQAAGAGSVFGFELAPGLRHKDFARGLELIAYAVSLGSVETLIAHPATQIHEDLTPAEREAAGISDQLIRVSVGIEDIADLQADLRNALDTALAARKQA